MPHDLCAFVTYFLQDKKTHDIVTIDLMGKSLLADYLVIATGTSSRQLVSSAQMLHEELKKKGLPTRLEGLQQADWILLDASSVIVHLLKPEMRLFYNLEAMWSLTVPESEGAYVASAG
ncbi:MAG: ribosome silencing factor [Alphaproteobacteria bacterium]